MLNAGLCADAGGWCVFAVPPVHCQVCPCEYLVFPGGGGGGGLHFSLGVTCSCLLCLDYELHF